MCEWKIYSWQFIYRAFVYYKIPQKFNSTTCERIAFVLLEQSQQLNTNDSVLPNSIFRVWVGGGGG